MSEERNQKIEAGAKDFALRFEGVMKELAEEEINQQDEERAMKEERETEYAESYQHPAE